MNGLWAAVSVCLSDRLDKKIARPMECGEASARSIPPAAVQEFE
jgi:hypothetical protein